MARSEGQLIADGRRMHEFLNDPVVLLALEAMNLQYYHEFQRAVSSDERLTAWAKSHYLPDFTAALNAVSTNGQLLEQARATRERREREV